MKQRIYKMFGNFRRFLYDPILLKFTSNHDSILDSRVDEIKRNVAQIMPDNILLKGYKCYSAGEEDGMIEAIFQKIIPSARIFLEIGCERGLENNSHFMLLSGWQGMWVDGNANFIQSIQSFLGKAAFPKLLIRQQFVDTQNVLRLFNELSEHYKTNEVDFFSLDIDGNDYHIMKTVFEAAIKPKVVCVEYNAKWGIHSTVKVSYDAGFVWAGDDYMGVSLGAWYQLFTSHGYTLLSCDMVGNNAFFIRNQFASLFTIYDPATLYQPARYYLTRRRAGHPPTLKMLKHVLNNE